MRLTVFGSTGRTGRQVLAEGNRRGHRITAFTRRPDTIADPSTLAAIVSGDGRDPDAVRAGIAGTDAVIAIIAAPSRKGPHHIADVAAMEHLVSTSGLDWTIARLNRLTDEPPRGTIHTSHDLLDRPSAITRTDAAAALLDIVEDETLTGTAVNLAGTR